MYAECSHRRSEASKTCISTSLDDSRIDKPWIYSITMAFWFRTKLRILGLMDQEVAARQGQMQVI